MSMHASASGFARHALAVARRLYWPLALACLAYAAYRAGDVLPAVVARAHPGLLLAATCLWLVLHLLTPVFSWRALRDAGADISYAQALRIHVARLPARYLPGGVWHTVSRVSDMRGMGIDGARLARLVALENSVPLGVATALGGACIAATGASPIATAAAAAGGAVVCAIPFVVRHRCLGGTVPLSPGGYAGVVLSSALFWLVAATAFTCYWSAYPAAAADVPLARIAGAYLLAWAAGFASVFAPQGIGVFEGIVGLFLRGAVPLAGTALVAAGFRLVILAADLLAFALLHLVRWRRWNRAGGH